MYEFAIGPVHPTMLEPHRLRLFIEDETIKDAELVIGTNFRGIELIMEGLPPEKINIIAEKVCGICSHIHVWTCVKLVEEVCNIYVPERAEYIRAIVEEYERIHSHMLFLGHILEVIGFETLAYRTFMIREPIMQSLEMITGNRVQNSCPLIGGIRPRCNIKERDIPKLLERIEKFKDDLKKLKERILNDPMIMVRVKEVGYLDKETAMKYHALGPTARASGLKSDMRKLGYVPVYNNFDFDEILYDEGDVYARIFTRIDECFESVKIIEQALNHLNELDKEFYNPNYELKKFKPKHTFNEAQRGQVMYSYGLDEHFRVRQVKIRTPTATNLACMEKILPGHHVSEAELIIVSCDPCFTCTDRMIKIIKE
ncbi:nickel-dependent hydrogenase large subunit [Methanocaldococcus indicus]|uniref:hydrogenase large subunit n=1 Tax=Methanocaldococcus indicus TaxID=213231 RepID=UPI003C6D3A76